MRPRNYIAGRWQAPALAGNATVCEATNGAPLFVQALSDAAQIEQAIAYADQTFASGDWQRLAPERRAAYLDDVAEAILSRADAIAVADTQATGVVISLTRKFAQVCAAAFRQAAGLVREAPQPVPRDGPHGALAIERLPLGPAAVIAPWNAPAGIAAHKIASALAAGCPVLVKPSEWAPLSAQLITEAAEAAALPAGMLQLLQGDARTGATLVADPRVRAVSFTGGLAGGRAVAAACAHGIKPVQLELGGNNPLVVLEDADVDAAVSGVVAALTTLNGQWCRALGRLLVHRSLEARVIDRTLAALRDLRIGNAMDEASVMGPLVSSAHREHVAAQVAHYGALGGVVHQVSTLPALGGWFYPPTLITGLQPAATLEEVFGPVATVHVFDNDAEAIALANQTPYGLAAYVFGEEAHAWSVARALRAGLIKINAVTMLNLHPQAPRPAWGLSGLGDEGTFETFEFFRGTRVTGVAARPGTPR